MNESIRRVMNIGLATMNATDEEVIAYLQATDDDSEGGRWIQMFAERWAYLGFPRVTLEHKHAAALMCMNTPSAALAGVKPPWDHFAIEIPNGLIEIEHHHTNTMKQIVNAYISVFPDDGFVNINYGDSCFVWEMAHCASLAQLGGDWGGGNRAEEMLARLVLGVCVEMTEHRETLARGIGPRPIRLKRGQPKPYTFKLTRNVRVDCRQSVRDYIRGTKPALRSTQHLVRGHWKRQACGVGLNERKWLFISPYWRGLEDVPIAVRAHFFGDKP